ncbi:MAG TPA: tRNA lysidine(34) synthetase TilS [Solirubrobacteraceae bacterium]|nr:tRNA lysidine(34) synthetase TilS [Solirubrobacteraceae bacterium]
MDLLERVRGTGLLADGAPVVVLLSGGRDSVCLLDCAARLGAATALHVNYGLRPDAGAEEAHCRSLCARLGVELTVERATRPDGAGNVQAWARDVRYAVGARLAERRGAVLAAGHTMTDQAETILYRLASSPSRRALLGMATRDGRLVRPLLGFSRGDTAAHCRTRGLGWVDDESNDTDAYARGRVRGALMPALEAIHPAAERNIVRAAQVLRDEADVLDEMVDFVLGETGDDDDAGDRIGIAHLRVLPPALGRLVVRRLAERATGDLCPRAASRYEDVVGLADDAMLDIGDGARAIVRRGVLSFRVHA